MGADHSCDHNLRREWAMSIVNSLPDVWHPLSPHPYVNFLNRNGFKYEEYLVRHSAADIIILCRTVYHLY